MLKAIETSYKGYRFRSRLEARWAVFFDTLGIPWMYEAEGYDLGKAGPYLPDFWLPTVTHRRTAHMGIWVEIKGQEPTDEEAHKCEALAEQARGVVVLMVDVPGEYPGESGYEWAWHPAGHAAWDNYMYLMQCHRCRHIKIEFSESNYMHCPKCGAQADASTSWLRRAYDAARAARFEHGERP